ncbi:hypothetical protein KQX54_007512 [Cotesia glomerata]|uniref:Uncharacterized protein n=1 Tax=Cotesia glomerata TaxID=32391 RepID=A0AAV7I6G9_COTGL|nr:hypothetical protein KQX54_007512 [Cotesia glomerata]
MKTERSNLYDTAYECEGKTLRIECGEGELIHLIRANYGRFSITICNEHGNTDWSVNCMAQKSFRVLYNKHGHFVSYPRSMPFIRGILFPSRGRTY